MLPIYFSIHAFDNYRNTSTWSLVVFIYFLLCSVSLLLAKFWCFSYPNYVYSVVSTITALFIDWYNISSFIINYPSYINYPRNELFANKTRDAKVNSDLALCWAMFNFLLERVAGLWGTSIAKCAQNWLA